MSERPMLERLEDHRVCSIEWDGCVFRLLEQCDANFFTEFTPLELVKLSNELLNLALNAIQPEG